MIKAIDIELLGKYYRVSCPQGKEEELEAARLKLENKMRELKLRTKVGNMEQLAVITALNFSYELGEVDQRNELHQQSLDNKIRLLQETVEQALTEQGML